MLSTDSSPGKPPRDLMEPDLTEPPDPTARRNQGSQWVKPLRQLAPGQLAPGPGLMWAGEADYRYPGLFPSAPLRRSMGFHPPKADRWPRVAVARPAPWP